MEKVKKKAAKWLCIAIALMLISMIVVSVVQTSGGAVTVKDLTWETTSGYQMSGLLFIPKGVSVKNPVPAIVTSHGMFNNDGMQDANFVELSRRGFVVLAMNMPSHGNSDPAADFGTATAGMYEAVKMLASINYIDSSKIGVTGHSMGGMSCNTSVTLDNAAPKHLISAVLLNSADATYTDTNTKQYTDVYGSRNVGIIAGQYDEFFFTDTDTNGNKTPTPDYVKYKNAQSFLYFGTNPTGKEPRKAETMYNETIDGNNAIRVIYTPAITHPWSHFSKLSTTETIEFFDKTLGAPNPIDPNNQIWQIKEFFNLIGLIGFAVFIVSFTILMVFTPYFSSLRTEEIVAPKPLKKNEKAWFWCSIAAAVLFGTITYLRILPAVGAFTTSKAPMAQSSPWGVGWWATACGLFAILCMVLCYKLSEKKNGFDLEERGIKISWAKLGKTILLAVIVVVVSYSCVFFADYFFKADFRIWVLAVKVFNSGTLLISLFPYMLLFLVYYIANSVAVNSFNYNTIGLKDGKGGWINTAIVAMFNALPAAILLFLQYSYFFYTGFLRFGSNMSNMFIVWLFPVLVILAVTAIMARKIYRVTNNPYLPGIINGVIVTLISCSNTLTWK